VTGHSTTGAVVEIPFFPHVSDLNQVCYDPRLYRGADYVVTSSLVRGRFEADPKRFAMQRRLYAFLDTAGETAARFRPHGGTGDPEIVIYRIGPRARAALEALGPLDPLWWAEFVPRQDRERLEALLLPPDERTGGNPRSPGGEPAPWVMKLGQVFATRYAPFARALSLSLIERKRPGPALALARSIVVVRPGDVQACLMVVTTAEQMGAWGLARAEVERSLRWLGRTAESAPFLHLQYADLLAHDGEVERARAELEGLLGSGDDYLIGEARRRLDALDREGR
jgi:hypothetical protein